MYKIQILNKFTGWNNFKDNKTNKTKYFFTKSSAMFVVTARLGNIKTLRVIDTEAKKVVFER